MRDVERVERLLHVIAARSGALASFQGMASDLGMDAGTARAYTGILESLFLVHRLRPWTTNSGEQSGSRRPSCMLWTAACWPSCWEQASGGSSRMEVLPFARWRALSRWSCCAGAIGDSEPLSLFHYRDKEQREVDVVLERYSGEVVGVEVKAAATVTGRDLAGLRHLRDRLERSLQGQGVVLYTGAETLPFGDRLSVVPLSGLWA